MSLSTSRTPERRSPLLGGGVVERLGTITTLAPGATVTLTAAQVLQKLIPLNPSEASTITFPTATVLAAGIPGIGIGDLLEVIFINYSNNTATLAMGTGLTNVLIDSEDAVLTVATHQALRCALVCTGLADPGDPSKSNTFDFYGYGVTAAATS